MYRGQTLQNLKLKIFLQKNSKTSTPLISIQISRVINHIYRALNQMMLAFTELR